MKANKIEESKCYELKVGKNTTIVKVVKIERRVNGSLVFACNNVKTNKPLTVSDEKRFIKLVKTNDESTSKKTESKSKKTSSKNIGEMSCINAAHRVLLESKRPMHVREIYETAVEKNYCNLNGLTPILTLSACLQLEIKKHGKNSRFKKIERGLFTAK